MLRILLITLLFFMIINNLFCNNPNMVFSENYKSLMNGYSEKINTSKLLIQNQKNRELILTEAIGFEWTGLVWIRTFKEAYFYNEDELIDEIKIYSWQMGFWGIEARYLLEYDEDDNVTEIYIQIWVPGWLNYYFISFIYENGNLIEELTQLWINESWTNSFKSSYTYENNLLINQIDQSWLVSFWQDTDQYWYTFDNSDHLIEILHEQWLSSEWIENYLNTLLNNESGYVIQDIGQYNFNNSWLNNEKIDFTYDTNYNLVSELYQYWYMNEWYNIDRNSYSYDDLDNMMEVLIEIWESEEWINDEKVEFTYEDVYSNEENIANIVEIYLSNYPNPFNPSTTISFSTADKHELTQINIYNLNGQKVKTLPVVLNGFEGQSSIIWNGIDDKNQPVSSGIYFYKLKSGKFEQTRKMILMK